MLGPPTRPPARLQPGIRDGWDAGETHAAVGVCFQHGKDIQMATSENVCGPLCGCAAPKGYRRQFGAAFSRKIMQLAVGTLWRMLTECCLFDGADTSGTS